MNIGDRVRVIGHGLGTVAATHPRSDHVDVELDDGQTARGLSPFSVSRIEPDVDVMTIDDENFDE